MFILVRLVSGEKGYCLLAGRPVLREEQCLNYDSDEGYTRVDRLDMCGDAEFCFHSPTWEG